MWPRTGIRADPRGEGKKRFGGDWGAVNEINGQVKGGKKILEEGRGGGLGRD